MKKKKLLVSVSGGRTSGLMAKLLFDRFSDVYEMQFLFANTSREKEETLEFVRDLQLYFGIPIVWVEAVVHHGERKGTTHRVVDFYSACRKEKNKGYGRVFEEVIKKYGIPNAAFPHCTRELKTAPIRSYLKSIGWGNYKKYTTAIGIRYDEPKRVNLIKAKEERQFYPLWEWGINNSDVLGFWGKQIFDLKIKGQHQGNCDKCYKKTNRKIATQILEEPEDRWIDEMEEKYSYFTPPSRTECNPPYFFFRNNMAFVDLENIALDPNFQPYTDNNKPNFDFELDEIEFGGCAESCEPF